MNLTNDAGSNTCMEEMRRCRRRRPIAVVLSITTYTQQQNAKNVKDVGYINASPTKQPN